MANLTDINELYNARIGGNINNLDIFFRYKFNENTDSQAYESSGHLQPLSHLYNLTISGATWQNDGVLVSLTEWC